MGMSTLTKPADHYGLSLILGGAEATLYDLAGIYAGMARSLNKYNESSPGIDKTDIRQEGSLDVASVWLTFEAMVEVARPDEEQQWKSFSSSNKIAWKTGTSFGNRDAWSVGVTPEYVVAVWVGNASGEGRPGLTGISVAAPILFDVFNALPPTSWFDMPEQAMIQVAVCRNSGFRTSVICDITDTIWVPKNGAKTGCCPYHQLIHLDRSEQWQVNSNCESPDNMIHVPWFVLPPVQEWYYRNKNPFYKQLPPFRPDCSSLSERKNMEIIYPKNNSKIYLPVDLDGREGSTVFKIAHRNPQYLVYWHLDNKFLGITTQIHQMAISPPEGIHDLTLVDQTGETSKIRFEVMVRK
jgi:penicillin-binding protein 1C